MEIITIKTHKKDEVIDITEEIASFLRSNANAKDGICFINVLHTTCCITTADLDPGTDLDLLDFLRNIEPKISYRHPHDPSHAPDHILSSVIGTSLSLPFRNKELILGTWQRVILIELDGPRERNVTITVVSP